MDRVDAVVQILPEAPFPDQLLQVHIRSADEPDVDRNGLASAHSHHAPALDHPQQLGLQVQRNIADFIEEQRSSSGLLELADMVRVRVRKRTLDMAEQLAFKQCFRNGSGVHRHHRLPAPQASGMDLPCQHVLAGAVLAGDEHRGIRWGDLLDGLPDGGHGLGSAPEHGSFALPFETLHFVQGGILRARFRMTA